MTIQVTGQEVESQRLAYNLINKAVIKDSTWWIDKPENGWFSYICRSTSGDLEGNVEAVVTFKDNLGNTVNPPDQYNIHWTSPDYPPLDGSGFTCIYTSSTQGRFRLNATYEGDIPDYNDPSILTHVNLSAEAIVILVYSNSALASSRTNFYNMTNHQFLPDSTGAEIFYTNEETGYINAPRGICKILDPETDPGTGEINGKILGSIIKAPDGCDYGDTKLELVNYATYIIKLSDESFVKVTPWMREGATIMGFIYSPSSSDGQFVTHF